jgi:hypothetical protein
MVRLTASKRALFSECQYWALPDVPWDNVSTENADAGHEAHRGFESLATGEVVLLSEPARAKTVAMRPVMETLCADKGDGPSRAETEVAFAWTSFDDTARVLGTGRAAYANAADHEMCGTTDLLVVSPLGAIGIYDAKNDVPGHEVDARHQLHTLALFAARALGVDSVTVGTILVNEVDARLIDVHVLDAFALDLEADTLRDALNQLNLDPQPRPGPWCRERYCPARSGCPATVEALAQTMPTELLTRFKLSAQIESEQHAAWSLTAVDLVEEACRVIKSKLRDFADTHGGILLEDGSTWAGQEVTTEKPTLDVPGALDVLERAGGGEAVTHTVTWAALERTIGRPKAKAVREELAGISAVKTSTHKRYEAKKPRRSRVA